MKKLLSLILVAFIAASAICVYAEEPPALPSDLRSQNILLIDSTSNRVIYEKNSVSHIQPGGISKILTAAVVIDYIASPDENVTADPIAVNSFDFSYNNIGVLPNETLTVRQLLYGMLLNDAGETANVLAAYCSGSTDIFVEKMNSMASEIGCLNSYFTNPSGLPDSNQYTTLEDAAKIVQYAMNFKEFREIVASTSYTISPTNKYYQTRYLNNTNRFLLDSSVNPYYNQFVTGVKTSYIDNSNCGLVITYENQNTKLLCLTMGAPYENGINYATEDCVKLIDYGINYHTSVKIAASDEIMAEIKVRGGKESDKVLLVAISDLYVNLPKGYDETKLEKVVETNKITKAPITKGDALGQLTVYYNGEKYASMVLTADQTISYSSFKYFTQSVIAIFTSWVFILIVVLIIGLFIGYTILVNKAKRRRKYVSRFRNF